MPRARTMHRLSTTPLKRSERGVVLPMALIMLVIISFAGLLAARNSSTFEQFSNNMRTNQVSRTAAEDALRQCERVARASVEGNAAFAADAAKIATGTVIAESPTGSQVAITGGLWNTHANWATGAANLITVTPQFGTDVQTSARLRNAPTCIVQAMVNDRFLVTARGLSNDAVVDNNGRLTQGSEVWLQSILTPEVPTMCPNGVC
jgi:type IV pilus assembly protein PilX